MKPICCPKDHGLLEQKTLKKQKVFRGAEIEYFTEAFVCPKCGLEVGTVQSAGALQRAVADAYRSKVGLLTGEEIKSLRKTKGLTQDKLSKMLKVGIASIKRWEAGAIQSSSMDHTLRTYLQTNNCTNAYTGERDISLCRIKCVARAFEKVLGQEILKPGDSFLFLAKYLWYADMLAFRDLGRGLTGASYAALTYGPQLNNYRDLVEPIIKSDENDADPLSDEEKLIIQRVADKFPNEREVYNAAHREKVWRQARTGALISYIYADELTEI